MKVEDIKKSFEAIKFAEKTKKEIKKINQEIAEERRAKNIENVLYLRNFFTTVSR